jgi:hypothetical protein
LISIPTQKTTGSPRKPLAHPENHWAYSISGSDPLPVSYRRDIIHP